MYPPNEGRPGPSDDDDDDNDVDNDGDVDEVSGVKPGGAACR